MIAAERPVQRPPRAKLLIIDERGGIRHTPVTGVVTMDGQPYENVMVTFIPADGAGTSVLPVAPGHW